MHILSQYRYKLINDLKIPFCHLIQLTNRHLQNVKGTWHLKLVVLYSWHAPDGITRGPLDKNGGPKNITEAIDTIIANNKSWIIIINI